MDKFERVMAALAFSPHTEEVFAYAARVAERLGAGELLAASVINSRDVDAVSTITALGYEVDGEHYVREIVAERRRLIDGLLPKIAFPAERVRTVVRVGNPVDELLKIAVAEQADLIVMGVKGRSNLEYALVGSVAEKVFRRSPVPVLSYRDSEHAGRLRRHIHLD